MDYIEAANAALAKRARADEQRKAVLEDATLTEADKRQRVEAIHAHMAELAKEADGHVRAAEAEAEVRSINERAAKLSGGRGVERRTEVRDEAQELRDLALGRREAVEFDLRTAESTNADQTKGGNTKPTTFAAQVLEAMRNRSQFFGRARLLTTSGGEVMEFPIKNALNPATPPVTLESGTILKAENTAYNKANTSWTKTNIGAYKYGVIVEATQEIVADSALPILSMLAADAGETVADAIVADLLLGNGTNKPWGWVTRATTSGVNAANLAGITFQNLLDLQYAVTAPYRRNGAYMFNDAAVPVLSKIVDGTGNYVWRPSVQAGEPDTIWGKAVLTDPNMAIAGAAAKTVLFGDPSKYMIRQVNSLRVTRSDEYGFDRDVIAFKVSWRGSGDLFDLNSVKALTVTA
ncbi:phage major capsid protein [Asanoa sp. WMMD1127]|uniref:phage major capsid protein n=1 Tax=Asanoa sp. WMMD1127 TaxID=3016107 RepID=UPI00241767B9|nr:phage major capsid protein [Asanoa sp. WMMD1127]MDG4826025.1 phage major capsid protein [Asanoa sp. WMMD1127]